MNWILLASTEGATYGVNIVDVIGTASGVVQAVLYFLIAMSLACWFIIGYKWYYFYKVNSMNHLFFDYFWNNKRLDKIFEASETMLEAPAARVFREAYKEMLSLRAQDGLPEGAPLTGIENVERAIRRATVYEVNRLERLVPFLGTTGSTAPFIGLFGTVWGIVEAFDAIPKGGGVILDKVAGPMAHALIATAVGLLAAIPAVMAYNWFVRKTKMAVSDIDAFSSDFLNIVRRHFFRS